jgi:hypothetical protein
VVVHAQPARAECRITGFFGALLWVLPEVAGGRTASFSGQDSLVHHGRRLGTPRVPRKISLPPDVQLAIAAQAVILTFHREQFLFDKFEKIIVFPRPFPTPEHPYDHASELHETDGCLLFAAEQVMLGFVKPTQWYNVAMHEYAKAFVLKYPGAAWPVFSEETAWEKLEATSGMPRSHVESVIGLGRGGCTSSGPAPLFYPFQKGLRRFFPRKIRCSPRFLGKTNAAINSGKL